MSFLALFFSSFLNTFTARSFLYTLFNGQNLCRDENDHLLIAIGNDTPVDSKFGGLFEL